jgi:hypothetical protein
LLSVLADDSSYPRMPWLPLFITFSAGVSGFDFLLGFFLSQNAFYLYFHHFTLSAQYAG